MVRILKRDENGVLVPGMCFKGEPVSVELVLGCNDLKGLFPAKMIL